MIIKYNLRKCALKIHESEHRILHEMHSILDMLTTHNQSVNEGYKIVLERFMLPRSGHAAIQTSDLFSVYDCGVLLTTMFLS
jgi:hypothetical protein